MGMWKKLRAGEITIPTNRSKPMGLMSRFKKGKYIGKSVVHVLWKDIDYLFNYEAQGVLFTKQVQAMRNK